MHYNSKAGNCTFIIKLIICTGIFLFSRYINSFAQLVPQGREQNTNYFFRHITQQDGLAHNSTHGITQDSKGFIWILTPNGLQRYDGSRFLYFKDMVSNPYEADNSGAALYPDYKNNFFWIVKQNKIEKFELSTNHFTVYESEQLAQTLTLKCDTLTDESNRPCLLGEHVIYFYDDAAKKFILYTINFNPYTKNISNSFITDTAAGQIWVNKHGTGLLLFDGKTKKIYSGNYNPFHHPMLQKFGKLIDNKDFVRAIMQDSHHNIWISSWFDLF